MTGPIQLAAQAHGGLQAHTVTPGKKKAALAVAAIADLIQLGLFPFFGEGALSIPDDVLDVVVAVVLFSLLGFKARVLLALAIELVPGVALFPSWTAVVATIPTAAPAPKALPQRAAETDALPETDAYSG